MKSGQGPQGRDLGRVARRRRGDAARPAERDAVFAGHARFESPRDVRVGDDVLDGRAHLHQRRRPRGRAADPGARRRALLDQLLDDGTSTSCRPTSSSSAAATSASSSRRCTGASAAQVTVVEMSPRLIAREDEDVSAAIREILEREGIAVRTGAEVHRASRSAVGRARSASTARRARRPSTGRTSCSPSAGGPTPTTSGSRRPASRSTRAATSRSTTSSAPTSPASGRSATATAAAPSPTRPTTTSRSSRRTCSTATRAASRDRIEAYALFIDPPLGRAGMTEAEAARKAGRRILVGKRPMTQGQARGREGRDAGLHEGRRRRRHEADPRRGDPRRRRRRGDPHDPRRHVREARPTR